MVHPEKGVIEYKKRLTGCTRLCRLPKQESPISSIALGIALGKQIHTTNAPCKGNCKKNNGTLELPLQGALSVNALYPGRCPGLWRVAPSGRAVY